jgi:membrane carboxypeptidase/penicillin-binding protein PbpC
LKPVLEFTNACASDSFNSYELEVTFINNVFNSDNEFTIELSNKDGDFTTPTTLKTISDKNSAFRFTSEFQIPVNTAGANYKIRVKSSSPETYSPETDSFEAYYMSIDMLTLNNFENVVLCEGDSKEIIADGNSNNEYQWYKDGEKLTLGGNSLSVNSPGLYYCEIYYGSCNSPATSNIVEVSTSDATEAQILGDTNVYLCENDTYLLEASVDNNLYTYSWFKDGVKVTGLPDYTPSITISDLTDLGSYSLEITNEFGCSYTSNAVTIESVNTDFSVEINTANSINILVGETKELSITHDAQNAEITWFKDNIQVPNSNSLSINITEPGTYYATVKSTSNNCTETKSSENIVVSSFIEFDATIITATDYTACESSEIQLSLASVKAIDINNVSYDLSDAQIALLNFEWLKDNIIVNGATEKQININTYENNGVYFLRISNGPIASNSNSLEVSLKLPVIDITSSSTSYSYCDNKQITLASSLNLGLNYQWYLNNSAIPNATNETYDISETGVYYLEQSDTNGCVTKSNEIAITNVDGDFTISTNSTSETFILFGETKVLEITHNAENPVINWFRNDILISNSSSTSITITEGGTYYATVTNTVEGCSETKSSENFIVNSIESFNAQIATLPNYVECASDRTQLLIESIKAVDVKQNVHDLTSAQINLLSYNWYKDDVLLNGFINNQYTIDTHVENGNYVLEVTNGSIKSKSNSLDIVLGVLEPVINSNDQTNTFCSTKQIILSSTQQNGVSYQWLLNGSPISGATEATLEIDAAGAYEIEVTNKEGCSKTSNNIVIDNFDTNFTIATSTGASSIILEGETKVLTISHNAQNAIVTWFKNDVEIPNSNTNSLSVTEPGIYYAIVEKSLDGCSETKAIDAISINSVESFTATITALQNYSECSSLQTQLTYNSIEVKGNNGSFYELTSGQIELLEFEWYKDNNIITGATNSAITISNYEENGSYFLRIRNGAITSTSNTLNIKLGLPEITISSIDDTYALCLNKEVVLSTTQINGLSYQWFFNDEEIVGETNSSLEVIEVGNYTVEATGFGCSRISDQIDIKSFDGNSIEFNFDDEITIQEGESITISANGADTYEWFDEDNNLIETSSSIDINKAGNYRVVAYLNGCSIEKFFTVLVVSGNVYVPNILTPNGDGVNDSWKIPPEFAFKNNIEVEIISNAGRTVLRQKNYQNNWPDINIKTTSLYFYIIRDEQNIIKKGTINILK